MNAYAMKYPLAQSFIDYCLCYIVNKSEIFLSLLHVVKFVNIFIRYNACSQVFELYPYITHIENFIANSP